MGREGNENERKKKKKENCVKRFEVMRYMYWRKERVKGIDGGM